MYAWVEHVNFSVQAHGAQWQLTFSYLCPTFFPLSANWSLDWSSVYFFLHLLRCECWAGSRTPWWRVLTYTPPPKRQHGSRDMHPPGRLAALHTYTCGNQNWCKRITCPYSRQPGSRPNIVLVVPTLYAYIMWPELTVSFMTAGHTKFSPDCWKHIKWYFTLSTSN